MEYKAIANKTSEYAIGTIVIFLSIILSLIGWILSSINLVTWPALSFLCGFYLVLRSKERFIIYDPMALMPIFAVLYCITTPILGSCLNIIGFLSSIPDEEIVRSTIYCEIYIYTYSLLTIAFKNHIEIDSVTKIFNARRSSKNSIIEIYMWLFSLVVLQRYNSVAGVSISLSASSRTLIIKSLGTIPFYSYQSYLFIGFSIYLTISFFNCNGVGIKTRHIFGIIPIITYFAVNILSGNRRELSYYIIAMFIYFVYRNKGKISKKSIAIGIAIFVSFLALSVTRIFTGNDNITNDMKYYTMFGEFINPMFTLRYYLRNGAIYKYGLTYFGFIPMLIPKSIWVNKPESLARTYVETVNAGMGYGFMPETEAYINFGYYGCVIGGIIHFCLCRIVCKDNRKHPYLYYALFCQLLNMFRGEFSSTFTEMIIISAALYLSDVVNKQDLKTQ